MVGEIAEGTESAEVEDTETVGGIKVGGVHEGCGFREVECTAFREDFADKLGTEIAVTEFEGDVETAEKKAEETVCILFPALEHMGDFGLCAVVDSVGDVDAEEGTGDISLGGVETTVEAFLHQAGREGESGVLAGEAVEDSQVSVEGEGNVGERFAGEVADQAGRDGGRASEEDVDGLHGSTSVWKDYLYYLY